MFEDVDRCAVCGQVVPEGRQLCPTCYGEGTEKQPNLEAVYRAAGIIKEYCVGRADDPETDCIRCPLKDICCMEPYLWEV